MRKELIFILILILTRLTGFSQVSELAVIVTGCENNRGMIRMGVFSNTNDFKLKSNPVDSAAIKLGKGPISYTFHNLPAGTYAIAVYHDENNDGSLNKKQMGIPVEGFGFSNFTTFKRKPPEFEEVCFELKDTGLTLEIPLFYNKKTETSNQP